MRWDLVFYSVVIFSLVCLNVWQRHRERLWYSELMGWKDVDMKSTETAESAIRHTKEYEKMTLELLEKCLAMDCQLRIMGIIPAAGLSDGAKKKHPKLFD